MYNIGQSLTQLIFILIQRRKNPYLLPDVLVITVSQTTLVPSSNLLLPGSFYCLNMGRRTKSDDCYKCKHQTLPRFDIPLSLKKSRNQYGNSLTLCQSVRRLGTTVTQSLGSLVVKIHNGAWLLYNIKIVQTQDAVNGSLVFHGLTSPYHRDRP